MRLWRVVCVVLLSGAAWGQGGPQPAKRMAADADPYFEVATIKLNAGAPFSLGNVEGQHFISHDVCLGDLVKFAYRVHADEVIGLPGWAMQERYDIAATMEPEGHPTMDQVRVMLKKLFAERFGLKAHVEQRVLPAYVLTVAKGGAKMKESDSPTMDAEHEADGGIEVMLRGATAKFYADFLQQAVVDRPVIDKTGLTGRYDFDVTFLPDNSMFGGRMHIPPNVPNAAPSLFTALEEIGLKLTPEKEPVDVVVVDSVARPSAN